jgi:uncharacterized membrane protein YhfC
MTLSLVFIALSALICLFAPAALAVWMVGKRGAKAWFFLLGAAVFAVFQILTRIPLLRWLQTTAGFTLFSVTQPVLYALLLAFTAGLFEECGRFLGVRFLPVRFITWENAFVFGLGHGGIEALYLVGLNDAVMFIQVLTGHASVPVLNTVMAAPPTDFLAGGAERILAVIMHIGFTMLVFYAVRIRKPLWLFVAIFAHLAADAIVPLLGLAGVSPGTWGTEGVLALLAAAMAVVTIRFKPLLSRERYDYEGGT